MLALLRPLLPHAVALAAILALLWWLDHRGYQRARTEMAAEAAHVESRLRADLRQSERQLGERIAAIDRHMATRSAALDSLHRTIIAPTVTKELARETRYSDPALGISDGLRAEINRALAAVACTAAADGDIVCTLPNAGTAGVE